MARRTKHQLFPPAGIMQSIWLWLFAVSLGGVVACAEGIDLSEKYPATLDWTEESQALEWTCEENDVWSLASFSYAVGDKFRVDLGFSQVVFGKDGTNVVWAAIFPEEAGKILRGEAGEGEQVTSIWMRFHPALVSTLFQPETVRGNGSPKMTVWAKRLYAHKINSSWQAGNKPVIPWRKSIIIDMETVQGRRRFYSIDTEAGTAKYEPYFVNRILPEVVPITEKEALEAFDTVWEAFDREYAMFSVKPHVDWGQLRDTYRPKVKDGTTSYELGAVLSEMLAHLEDLHVHVMVGSEYVPGYTRPRPLNANWNASSAVIGGITDTRQDLAWGKTGDGIGYVNIYNLGNQQLPKAFDEVLERLSETWALVVDLRFNGGGDETLAEEIAGRFGEEYHVYSTNRYRSGPKHSDLGPVLSREFGPRGPWRYESPVVALTGQRTMSSAESFALMLAQCPQVTTLGDRTAGSSANPRRVQTTCDITVNLPRWLDMDPEGNPIDKVGVSPDVRIETTPEDFSNSSDPVLEAALKRLREAAEANREPGKRE